MIHAATALVLLLGAGCGTLVKVDSLARPGNEAAISYEIKNGNPLVTDDSLRFKEAAGFVKTALSGKGMYEAPAGAVPDMVVDLDYGIGPPVTRRDVHQVPIYRTIPGATRTETVATGTDAKGNTTYSTVTYQDPPRRVFEGMREEVVYTVVYEKFISLTARENKPTTEGQPDNEIWTVDVTSEGTSRDVRKTLPVLVAASIDYIGKDTQGQKSIRIKDNDSNVAFVKKGM